MTRKTKVQAQSVDLDGLKEIIDQSNQRPLTEEEQQQLRESHSVLESFIGSLFRNNESSKAVIGKDAEPEEHSPEAKKPRKGHGRRGRGEFTGATVVPQAHPLLKPGDRCPNGCSCNVYALKRPLLHRSYESRPPILLTIYELQQLRCSGCEEVFQAPLPADVNPETYDATVTTTLGLSRYGLGTPFHRQAEHLAMMGIPLPAGTMYGLIANGLKKIKPVYKHLKTLAANGEVGHFDDTRGKILDLVRAENDKRTGVHTTASVIKHPDWTIALFTTGPKHAGENRAELLENRDPGLPDMIQMSDALAANFSELESDEDVICSCMAHGRRNFVKIAENFPEECRHVLTAIGTVYHNEKLSAERGDSPEQRLAFHQKESGPVLMALHEWMEQQLKAKAIEPNSSLGKAVQYLRNHWDRLTLFLRVANAPLDNNVAERALKKAVLHRKNSLFYKTVQGALTGDIYMSLIYTCKLNEENPFDYLTALQRHAGLVEASPGDWLPWTYRASLARAAPPAT